jgi:hypothetical protein
MTLTKTDIQLALSVLAKEHSGREFYPEVFADQFGRMALRSLGVRKIIEIKDRDKTCVGAILPYGSGRAIKVVLNFLDLYDVSFLQMRLVGNSRGEVVVKSEYNNVYADQLTEVVAHALSGSKDDAILKIV